MEDDSNFFRLNNNILCKDLQEGFSEMNCSNSIAKSNFEAVSLTDFSKYVHIYAKV